MNAFLIRANALSLPLRDESVDCVVTSPPYYRLRDYGVTGQIGLEETLADYLGAVVVSMRQARRVLRPRGTLWLVVGDSYAADRSYQVPDSKHVDVGNALPAKVQPGFKRKDLLGVPWRIAFALQDDGWWLRCDIVWSKDNPMPESVKDRPRSHEYIFLLSKSESYYYDADAIKEDFAEGTFKRLAQPSFDTQVRGPKDYGATGAGLHSARRAVENLHRKFESKGFRQASAGDPPHLGLEFARDEYRERVRGFDTRRETPGQRERRSKTAVNPHHGGRRQAPEPGEPNAFGVGGRNSRSVWTIPTQPYPHAHFATFPEELARRCVVAGCPPGGIVLDPFAGSGTIGRVAIAAGRYAVLSDLGFHALMKRRCSGVQRPLALPEPHPGHAATLNAELPGEAVPAPDPCRSLPLAAEDERVREDDAL